MFCDVFLVYVFQNKQIFFFCREFFLKKPDFFSEVVDVLVFGVYQEKQSCVLSDPVRALDNLLDHEMTHAAKEEQFVGKINQMLLFRTLGKLPAKRVLLVGLGKKQECDLETIRVAAANMLSCVKQTTFKSVACVLFGDVHDVRDRAQAMTEGMRLADYEFRTH